MKRAAMLLYKKACILHLPFFQGRHVETDLALLHPGERVEYVKTEYYVKKISICLTILAAGAFLGLAAKISADRNAVVGEGGIIYRGNYDGGERQILLEACDGEEKWDFTVSLSPRILTEEETRELSERFLDRVEELILGDNEDIWHISSDLDLRESYQDFPFEVTWESSRMDILDSGGRVQDVERPANVVLKAILSYQDFSRSVEVVVTVVPESITPKEQEYLEMQEYLEETERSSRGEEGWILPSEWKGKSLDWSLASKDYSYLIWMATPVVALSIYLSSDRDLRKELEKKQSRLGKEYPELVHKLALYVGAGMTMRGAFQKIGGDYEKKMYKGSGARPGCEEVVYTCRELQAGVAEGAAYEHFGKRTGMREYIRLSTLLGQNLKRGNSALLDRLREEAEKASEESLLRAKKLGEEAGTKLLVPMVLMLAIVMAMIMIPAFGTM